MKSALLLHNPLFFDVLSVSAILQLLSWRNTAFALRFASNLEKPRNK